MVLEKCLMDASSFFFSTYQSLHIFEGYLNSSDGHSFLFPRALVSPAIYGRHVVSCAFESAAPIVMTLLDHIRAFLEYVQTFAQRYWSHWYLATLIVFMTWYRLLANKYGRGLNQIPGPFIAGFTDLWRFFDACNATPHETHIRLHRQTNSHFVRIGPRTVSISDPSLIPTIYGINSGFTKSEFYTLSMLPYKGKFRASLFTALDEDYHTLHKKPIAKAYSMSTLMEFEPLVDSTASLFMSILDQFAASGISLDFGVWLQRYAFDVLYVLSRCPYKVQAEFA